jgi:hypothetical protein
MRLSLTAQSTDAVIGGLSVRIGKRSWSVESLEDASAWFVEARKRWSAMGSGGASKTPMPRLCRDGEPFAHISYNGRVWAGAPRPPAIPELLYDPPVAVR